MSEQADRLRQKALRLLAMRDHSRTELERKLAPLGTPEEVRVTLDRMTELGLQSDRRFAEAWVRGKAPRFGTARLKMELTRRGVDADVVAAVLSDDELDSDIKRARAVWAAKFGTPAADRREWARQARFMQGRGFSSEVITRLLKEVPDESA
ncbi:MAG: recombination regulator RecX [Zoogloeaceae bacterium]|nr:recombination regulator RecX [Zoogloeaceae bacterium]